MYVFLRQVAFTELVRSLARFVEGVPVLVASSFGRGWYRRIRRNCGLGNEGLDHSLDRLILLILGSCGYPARQLAALPDHSLEGEQQMFPPTPPTTTRPGH